MRRLLPLCLVACAETRAVPPAPPPSAPSPTAAATSEPPKPAGPLATPRLIAPITGAGVYTNKPTFVIAAESDDVEIEVCADRSCKDLVTRLTAKPANGTARATPATALVGTHVFYRARAVRGADKSAFTPAFHFLVRKNAPGVDTSAVAFSDPTRADLEARYGKLQRSVVVGDVDGDGYSDAIGMWCTTSECAGAKWVVASGAPQAEPTPIATTPSEIVPLGDVNGDGFADVVIPENKRATVWYGSAKGLSAGSETALSMAIGGRTAQGLDFNGDGYMDYVAVGVPNGPNHALVYYGGAKGLLAKPSLELATGTNGYECFGDALAFGDLNGDGVSDIVFGAYCAGPKHRGRVYVFNGGAQPKTEPAFIIDEPANEATSKAQPHFGLSVGVTDGDGDGIADLYASTSCYLDDKEKGYCKRSVTYLYKGSRNGLAIDKPENDVQIPKD